MQRLLQSVQRKFADAIKNYQSEVETLEYLYEVM
jgi:hypothetical protein